MAELLAPCGSVETLNAAIAEGADAVYLGLKSFNARMRTNNFSWAQFAAAVDILHKRGKKIFVTLNTVVTQEELSEMYATLEFLNDIKPDGVIVQDFGVLQLLKDFFPQLKAHASTQMNIASSAAANAMSRAGVSRVVLARELSLAEIREIKKNTTCELEVFVHGALCVSESGLCLFSSFLGGKSANRGMCTQACRRLYTGEDNDKKPQGYFFSPYDLQLLKFIPELVQAGVTSFKIEGRMKSAEYVGTVVSAYRYMLDHWQEDREAAYKTAVRILENDFARDKTDFLFDDADNASLDKTLNPNQNAGTGIFLGSIARIDKALSAKVQRLTAKAENAQSSEILGEVKETQMVSLKLASDFIPRIGDSIRLHRKDDTHRESWKLKNSIEQDGVLYFEIPKNFSEGDTVYLLQTKSMSKRYPDILAKSLSSYKKRPNLSVDNLARIKKLLAEKIAVAEAAYKKMALGMQKQKSANKSQKSTPRKGDVFFPDGFFVQVSSMNDVYVLLSMKPDRVIINLNEDTERFLTNKQKSLPFARSQIFISFDPFVGEGDLPRLQKTVTALLDAGYKNFIVNNPAHIALLRNKKLTLVAGPYLYMFNRFSLRWAEENGISRFISPLENSLRNLDASLTEFPPNMKNSVLITVFNYPPLFRLRRPLPQSYNFQFVSDKKGELYRLLSTPSQSFVLPEKPFSITEKIASLRNAGYQKFLIDFSQTAMNKGDYKAIFTAALNSEGLSDTSKFNWKEGFYDKEKVERLKELGGKNRLPVPNT